MHFSGPENLIFFLMRTPDPQFSDERAPKRTGTAPTLPPIPTSELEASQSF